MSAADMLNPSAGRFDGGDQGSIVARDQAVKKMLVWAENIILFIVLFQFSTALVGLLMSDPFDLESDSPFARMLWYPGYVLALILVIRNIAGVVRLAVFNPILVLCVLWCGLSYFWSIDPQLTIRRTVALLMTTVLGLAIAARYDWHEMVSRFALVFLSTAIISLIVAVVFPDIGRMQEIHEGAWRGAWLEKNSFGTNMAKGVMVMMCAYAMRPSQWWVWVPAGVLCFILVILSTSKAALLASLVAILGFLTIRVFRRFPMLRIPLMYSLIIGTSVFVFLMLVMPDAMFELIGKDRTLTGRTDIWNSLVLAIKQKPLLGYGYGTFWADTLGPSYWVRFSLEWGVPTAHNGWIETWLSAGVVAVILFAILFVLTSLLALDRLYRGGVENYWVILSTLLFFLISMSESTILQQNELSWVIFVATSSKLFSFAPAYWRDRPKTPYFQPPQRHTI